MDLERFSRRTKAAAFREAANAIRGGLNRISKRAWHPLVDQALRHTAVQLDDKVRQLEQGED